MKIYITTMNEIPDSCYDCPCSKDGICAVDNPNKRSSQEYRPYWCPLQYEKPKEENAYLIPGKIQKDVSEKELSDLKTSLEQAKIETINTMNINTLENICPLNTSNMSKYRSPYCTSTFDDK